MIVDTAETLAVGNEVYFEFAALFTTIRFVVGLCVVVVIIGLLVGLSVLLTVGLFVLPLLVAVGLLLGRPFSSVLLVQVKECAEIST